MSDQDTQVAVVRDDPMELSVTEIKRQVNLIQEVMESVMKNGHHYGVIPGTGGKATLLKPGAEKLCMTFRAAPRYRETVTEMGNGHRDFSYVCELYHISTGVFLGEGIGSCSTMETKYRYRNSADYEITGVVIPDDAKEKKAEYRKKGFGMKRLDGMWCWVKYSDSERGENPDIADTYNTCRKQAKKRAHVDAALTAFAASDIFAQDLDDVPGSQVDESTEPASGKQGTDGNGSGGEDPQSSAGSSTSLDQMITYINAGDSEKEVNQRFLKYYNDTKDRDIQTALIDAKNKKLDELKKGTKPPAEKDVTSPDPTPTEPVVEVPTAKPDPTPSTPNSGESSVEKPEASGTTSGPLGEPVTINPGAEKSVGKDAMNDSIDRMEEKAAETVPSSEEDTLENGEGLF